tara:strand:- start:33535 stop:34206 length:672 start_codon:yes stop_codon:yes gene_type:complete
MYIDYKLKQGSEEWHELKNAKIGGTRAKSVQVKKSITEAVIFDEVMSERNTFFNYEEGFTSEAMQRGIDLEPLAIEEVTKETGIIFKDAGWIGRNDFHGHSPDGISLCEKIGLEIKCPSAKVHNSYVRENKIPLEYVWQIVNFFAMDESIERLYFASFNPDYLLMPLFLLEVTRESIIFTSKKDSAIVSELAEDLNKNVDDLILKIKQEEKVIIQRISNKLKF